MSRRAAAIAIAGVTFGSWLLSPLVASQPAKPPRGARIAVVAYHDSRLLTLCPVLGKDVIESTVLNSSMGAKASVSYPPIDMQSMSVVLTLDDGRLTGVLLPMPAGRFQIPGPVAHPFLAVPGYLDRLARDLDVEQRLAGQFRARKTYTIVDSPADADFVFVAESTYTAVSLGTADTPLFARVAAVPRDMPERIFSDSDNEWTWRMDWRVSPSSSPSGSSEPGRGSAPATVVGMMGGDRHTNWRRSIVALAVPAAVYLQHAGDGAALSAAGVWRGIAAAGWGPRTGGTRTMGAASPETLADRFHEKGQGLPDYLPVCAATIGPLRSIHDTAGSAPASQPGEPAPPRSVAAREPAGPLFRSNVTFITVPVTVTDRSGDVVRGLPRSAFHVFEDDVEQTVDRLDVGTTASDVALLVDTSAGMREPRERLRTSAAAFAMALRAADRAMVVKFASRIQVLSEFSRDRPVLQAALGAAGPGGGTRLYDALALIAVDRLGSLESRKAVILLTDGLDTQSQLTNAAGALAAMEAANTPVYIIRYDTPDVPSLLLPALRITRWVIAPERPGAAEWRQTEADQFLMELSTRTGGGMYAARPDAEIPEMIAHIAEDQSNQLVLGYYPTNDQFDGSYRRIRVAVDCDGCTVRARAGYRAGMLR